MFLTFTCVFALTVSGVTSNFEVLVGDIVITKQRMFMVMRKPQTLTNIDEDIKLDDTLAKNLAKAFATLKDLEEEE